MKTRGNKKTRKKQAPESAQKTAEKNFKLWLMSLRSGNPLKAADLYTADATFLPTLSPDLKKGSKEARNYFDHFFKKNPIGRVGENEIQFLGKNCYLHSGMYDFEVDGDGARSVVPARFTFVWRRGRGGKWKIIHHHSSRKP